MTSDEGKKVQEILNEAKFNAAFRWDVMVIMNPVINELRIEIVQLREELAKLRSDLCLE